MERDPLRQKIKDLLWKRGLTMKEASAAIGRSPSYMHQFLERGTPAALNYGDSEKLAGLLACDAGELRPAEAPKRKPQKRRRRTPPGALPGAPLAAIPEMAVEAAAGAGAAGEEFATEKARWYLPEGMIRHEGDAEPGNLRVLRARGDSMEPLVSDGDRLLVDVTRRAPGTGETAVLWDGTGLRGQAGRGPAQRRAAEAQADLRQPRVRTLHMPRRGRPHRRQGPLDLKAHVKAAAIRVIYTQRLIRVAPVRSTFCRSLA